MKGDASQGQTGIEPLRILQFGSCLFIYFWTLGMLVLTLALLCGWVGEEALAEAVILLAILAPACVWWCLTQSLWVEIGDRLTCRNLLGVRTHDWSAVKGIAIDTYSSRSGPPEVSHLVITLANGKEVRFAGLYGYAYEKLPNIIGTLVEGLRDESHDTRERGAVALGRFGTLVCSYRGARVFPAAVVDLKKRITGHLEQALRDGHENVRKASADALRSL